MKEEELRRLVTVKDAERSAVVASATLEATARDSGLLDVGIATLGSPLGDLLIAVTPKGLVRIAYPDEDNDDVIRELATHLSPRLMESAAMTGETRRELDEYFEGRRRRFDQGIDWRLIKGFARRTLRAVSRVPFGAQTTYGALAARIGSPDAARAVGNALGTNPIPIVIPCHRVLRAHGGLGGYSGGIERKRYLLDLEGTGTD